MDGMGSVRELDGRSDLFRKGFRWTYETVERVVDCHLIDALVRVCGRG